MSEGSSHSNPDILAANNIEPDSTAKVTAEYNAAVPAKQPEVADVSNITDFEAAKAALEEQKSPEPSIEVVPGTPVPNDTIEKVSGDYQERVVGVAPESKAVDYFNGEHKYDERFNESQSALYEATEKLRGSREEMGRVTREALGSALTAFEGPLGTKERLSEEIKDVAVLLNQAQSLAANLRQEETKTYLNSEIPIEKRGDAALHITNQVMEIEKNISRLGTELMAAQVQESAQGEILQNGTEGIKRYIQHNDTQIDQRIRDFEERIANRAPTTSEELMADTKAQLEQQESERQAETISNQSDASEVGTPEGYDLSKGDRRKNVRSTEPGPNWAGKDEQSRQEQPGQAA